MKDGRGRLLAVRGFIAAACRATAFLVVATTLTTLAPGTAKAQEAALERATPLDQTPPASWLREWPDTDFSRNSVDFAEIFSGGPPKDGIPSVDAPSFQPVSAETALDDREPVVALTVGDVVRAYPARYLMWREIVNDRIGDRPIAVTYCPLCNSAVVFDGRHGGRDLTFGVTGKLRFSDMVMYDRQTESWWQQFTGEGIAGEMTGETLTVLPSALRSWKAFREAHPEAEVMREPTDAARGYGRNPYVNYDRSSWPFLYKGETPPHGVAPLERVVRVDDKAWPLTRVAAAGTIEEAGVEIRWVSGQASALEAATIADGRDVGDIYVADIATGAPVVHEVVFAFAFHAFEPDGEWMMDAP